MIIFVIVLCSRLVTGHVSVLLTCCKMVWQVRKQVRILVLLCMLSAKLANARLQQALSTAERGHAVQLPIVAMTPMPLACKGPTQQQRPDLVVLLCLCCAQGS